MMSSSYSQSRSETTRRWGSWSLLHPPRSPFSKADPSAGDLISTTTTQVSEISERNWGWLVWPMITFGLLLFLYAPVLRGLAVQWSTDPDYSYGFFIPVFSAYTLWLNRGRLLSAEIRPSNFGLPAMIAAICLLFLGSLGAELFTSRFSLLVLLSGIILFLAGWRVLGAVSFPLGFLIFMIPIPAILYNQITFPMQLLASRLASSWLELVHVPVLRNGNILVLSSYSLEVVEACSGIRSLMTLVSLAVAYGYLAESRRWVRCTLAVLMVPSAIVTNAIRVMVIGILAHTFGPATAEGFLHVFSGWLVFLAALFLLLLFHRILRRVGNSYKDAVHA
jgi:exosortase